MTPSVASETPQLKASDMSREPVAATSHRIWLGVGAACICAALVLFGRAHWSTPPPTPKGSPSASALAKRPRAPVFVPSGWVATSVPAPTLYEPPPPPKDLPRSAPKSVHLGIVLVRYRGAERAPAKSPSKKDAFELAQALAVVAEKDFSEAVKRGHSGSGNDLGKFYRGVLPKSLEYQVFTMKVGQVKGPLDTPRGFWVVKRTK